MYTGKEKRTGFTLVEVALAMIILAVGVMSVASIIMTCLWQEQTSREYDIARSAAAAELEEIRGADFDSICLVYSGTNFAVMGLDTQVGDPNPGYITINSDNANLLDVTVTIRWASLTGENVNLDLTMKTMVARSDY